MLGGLAQQPGGMARRISRDRRGLAPPLTPAFLYPRLVWGGLWGFLFLIPLARWSFPVRGLFFSLGPTLAQLFVVFPHAQKGVLGLQLGSLTPLLVVFYNAIWGYGAGWWLNWAGISRRAGSIRLVFIRKPFIPSGQGGVYGWTLIMVEGCYV